MENKYLIVPKDELYHWKYIKREKQANGKYKYYYTLDQLKKDATNAVKNATGVTKKENYQKIANASRVWQNQAKSAAAKNILTNPADKDPAKNYGASYIRLADQARKHNMQRAVEKAENAYRNTAVGKVDKAVDNAAYNVKKVVNKAKNLVKDAVGYDDKAAAEKAKVNATVKKYEADDTYKKNDEWLKKYYTHDPETGALIKKKGYDNVKEMADWQNNYYKEIADEARDAALAAEYKYNKTPLAAFEKISGKVDKMAERGKRHVKNAIGYDDKTAYESAKRNVTYYENKVKEYEETIKNLPPRDKVISKDYLDYMDRLPGELSKYQSKLDSAKRDLKQQEKDYMDTPLNKISKNERVYELVDGLLNGTSTKRKKR